MSLIPAKTPGFVKSLFPNFVWNIDTHEKALYLTFDDGPTPEITEWVLETLETYNAKATFFCIGNNISLHPRVFHKIIEYDHSIGNHTYMHLKGWKTKTQNYLEDITAAQKTILEHMRGLDIRPQKMFRPPYGKLKTRQAKQLQKENYKIIMWDVLSFDWDASTSEEECFNNVILSAKEGSIIVFHDSIKASQNLRHALPRVLDYYSNKGFKFKSIELT